MRRWSSSLSNIAAGWDTPASELCLRIPRISPQTFGGFDLNRSVLGTRRLLDPTPPCDDDQMTRQRQPDVTSRCLRLAALGTPSRVITSELKSPASKLRIR